MVGTRAALVVAMFDERESVAVWLLGEQGVTHYDAVSFVNRQRRARDWTR
jgi:hypothetical protein